MFKKVFASIICFVMAVTMSFTAFAAEFTPSVTAKPAPAVVSFTDKNGQKYAAAIYDANGKLIANVPESDFIITPYSEAGKASNSQIKNNLETSYNQIKAANRFTDLCPDVESAVKKYSSSVSVDDLVAKDLFDVYVAGEYADYLGKDGNYIETTFSLSYDSSALACVLQFVNGEWVVVPAENIIRNGSNVTLRLNNAGPVVFLYDNGELQAADPSAPKSPNTGEMNITAPSMIAAAGVAMALGAFAVIKGRKLSAEK